MTMRETKGIDRNNLAAFARRTFTPSVTDAVDGATLAMTLLGAEYDMPISIAPIGLTSLMRRQ